MQRSDRLLAILLHLRGGAALTAAELAARLEVSPRTIYRDVDALSGLGIPVYAEKGPGGGFRLLEGYFLPAIAFSRDEAVALVLALTALRSLRDRPLDAALDTAEAKLLSAMPSHLSALLADAGALLGFEGVAHDAFHPEPDAPSGANGARMGVSAAVDIFLRALLDGSAVRPSYRSPFRATPETTVAEPCGLFWDRDRWYLVGRVRDDRRGPRLWRADRVLDAAATPRVATPTPDFDVRTLLGRRWLQAAMADWAEQMPVRIRMTTPQAARLQADWYYCHARYERQDDGTIIMTFGDNDPANVRELVRWLGPGAGLLEPHAWRAELAAELSALLRVYDDAP